MLDKSLLPFLKKGKNLLGFSYGVDSTALFYLLVESGIEFDIALVNYKVRAESDIEEDAASDLAKKYNKRFFTINATIQPSNFEKNARDFRYSFFESLIKEYGYDHLILAHQMNDKLEWFMMQLCKGAGVVELLGFEGVENRGFYKIFRPLHNTTRGDLIHFLESQGHKYFIDSTNSDTKFKRNFFRKNITDSLIKDFENGIRNSFAYLQGDKNDLFDPTLICNIGELFIIKNEKKSCIKEIDACIKKLGYLCSKAQRDEVEKNDFCVVGGVVAVEKSERFIYIYRYTEATMDKAFKERCRKMGIPKHLRKWIYKYSSLEELEGWL